MPLARRSRRLHASLGLLVAVWLAWAAPAVAVERGKLFGGAAIGAGFIGREGVSSEPGLAAAFHLGWMFGQTWGVVLDGHSVLHPTYFAGESQLTSAMGGIGARYFPTDRLWLQLVFGSGRLDTDLSSAFGAQTTSAAVGAGTGFELVQSKHFALDLTGRFGYFKDGDRGVTNLCVAIGLNLY